jgi:ATP-dependent DNA helicase RecG
LHDESSGPGSRSPIEFVPEAEDAFQEEGFGPMNVSLQQLGTWLEGREDEHLEFKEAKTQYDSEKLTKYCVAIANEGGGHIVFGITNKKPRRVVGTNAFTDVSKLKRDQSQRVRLHIDATEAFHPDGRVVVISVPPRPIGMPMEYKSAYWMRRGEALALY